VDVVLQISDCEQRKFAKISRSSFDIKEKKAFFEQ